MGSEVGKDVEWGGKGVGKGGPVELMLLASLLTAPTLSR